MKLPAWIKRVCYKVAGSYVYRGDLIVTREAIFYFPHTDLRKKWEQQPQAGEGFGMLGPIGKGFGSAVDGAVSSLEGETISLFDQPSPTLDLTRVWSESKSVEELQSTLDAYFAELKEHGSRVKSSSDLPTPKRYRRDEVKHLSLTLFGTLKFDAQYDDHIFKVGIINKSKTQEALQESGFLS